jgi:2-haloacid dehalogenase
MDLHRFEYLTFDCYGTLIDWESGILAALRPILESHRVAVEAEAILSAYAELEQAAEAGPYQKYRLILEGIVGQLGERFGFEASAEERASLPESISHWKPFPDTVQALKSLKKSFRLGVISNIDRDLFSQTVALLENPFDAVVTAEEVGAYKPAHKNFLFAQEKLGLKKASWLHVAQSKSHDIVPTRELGISNVWVNRQTGRTTGAVVPVTIRPDLEVKTLAELVGVLLG